MSVALEGEGLLDALNFFPTKMSDKTMDVKEAATIREKVQSSTHLRPTWLIQVKINRNGTRINIFKNFNELNFNRKNVGILEAWKIFLPNM